MNNAVNLHSVHIRINVKKTSIEVLRFCKGIDDTSKTANVTLLR